MKISDILRWADSYPYFYFHLQNNPYDDLTHYRWIVGVAKKPHKETLSEGCWYMGGWTYEWRARHKKPWIEFPKQAFFVPQIVIAQIEAPEYERETYRRPPVKNAKFIQSSMDYAHFTGLVERLREHIYHGEVYQVNLTLGLQWEAIVDPIAAYLTLLETFPTTFNYLFKYQQKYIIGASPERFFWQWRHLIVQQPIKGTAPRGTTLEKDLAAMEALRHNPKELAENTMIVDLVRNDLQRVCVPGSVYVPVLAGVQTFPGLHHLVSTVCGERVKSTPWTSAVESLFPPGSMTGAPKHAAMHYIHQYEPVGRGFYSGAIGYIAASGEADFAVVIRSWIYDKLARRLVLQVGSGITYDSNPVAEWEEAWLKAEKLLSAFGLSASQVKR
ncbi:MAG: anthranilate synthase component I family protein [Bacteroidia bacterium]|nr:anthranilate synthase component I family protein [Bacteroidia bacterium]MCX7652743.1 anthranilate synthase component I family protein [Bacteroidia bacterium]MDW8417281.1 anthranilate synthase component I family protein [Bacteroidia bacterium]